MSRVGLRWRLALLYAFAVVLVGGVLLLAGHLLLSRLVDDQPVVADQPTATAPPGATGNDKQELADAASSLRRDFRQEVLPEVLRRELAVLAGLVVVSPWVGWLIAGQAVRPMTEITAATRRLASRGAVERLDHTGPRDEVAELAETVDDLLARLAQAVEGQWHFVANASHELKTPLAINRTLLEVAEGRPDATPALSQLCATLLEVNRRHETLINGLLVLARSQQTLTRPVPVDLAQILAQVAETTRSERAAADVQLTVTAGPEPVGVLGDASLLERLVLNLVQNAVRHNEAGGWVTVALGTEGQQARLTVANTGPAVAGSDVPGLFEPFRRADERTGQGTGLGLSIVRSVAQAHGGEVGATPRPGGGLVVTVTLPLLIGAGERPVPVPAG